jgi:hypothetical protein
MSNQNPDIPRAIRAPMRIASLEPQSAQSGQLPGDSTPNRMTGRQRLNPASLQRAD